jgi:sensor histidine kinase YesM
MDAAATCAEPPNALARILHWRRLRVVLVTCAVVSLIMLTGWKASYLVLLGRLLFIGVVLLLAFGLLERWPERLPPWLARWELQVLGVAVCVPFAVAIAYALTTIGNQPAWFHDKERLTGYASMVFFALLLAPWIAIAALIRQVTGAAQRQALAFDLERSEFDRQALDERLRVLQAQVEPHFLFNTLANVRELVDTGSAQAAVVLEHLIAYLRAAVPRLHEASGTLKQELELVRAYLEVMHMRMPDRLQFSLHAEPAALDLFCPPMTLLTLVENAVRHGIDPGEEGGRIDVRVQVQDGRCRCEVIDSGVGLGAAGSSLGTGLSNLRERLQLAFGGDAQLQLASREPHGTRALLDFPARSSAP